MPRLSKIGAAALAAFGWTGLSSVTASYLVVAGGGGGGYNGGGGGGAGGYLTGTTSLNPTQSFTVTVGAGGGGGTTGNGTNGSSSVFNAITSTGGGGGGQLLNNGLSGGSGGGGGSGYNGSSGGVGGAGTSGQGNAGGTGYNLPSASPPNLGGGGGGGAGAVGSVGVNTQGGAGGNGTASSISGSSLTYAGGGGGGGGTATVSGGTGGGGTGGGGSTTAIAGTANLGGGGGGGGNPATAGGQGGSGVVIISYVGAQQFGGGVVTSSGGNTIHTFTTSGTLSPLNSLTANFLVVAGGAGGGEYWSGGGGGAGGLRSSVTNTGGGGTLESALTIDTNSIYLVTVGAGGAGAATGGSGTKGANGSNSAFLSVASTGGGAGGLFGNTNGNSGGSGGGGFYGGSGGAGTANQGRAGGAGASSGFGNESGGGGGGGAGTVGAAGAYAQGGNGGNGVAVAISGTSVTYAGGGGGSVYTGTGGTGGSGGGADGVANGGGNGKNGTANTGGGASGTATNTLIGGNGGSGIVIISYPGTSQQMAGGTVTVAGGNVIHTFTSSGYLAPIYSANNSLRFRASASAYLDRTFPSAGNRKTYTLSLWVKRGNLGGSTTQFFFGSGLSTTAGGFYFTATDNIEINPRVNNTNTYITTTQVFRDPSAWYHIVIQVDTTQATDSNRLKLYVNGVQVTALSTAVYPALNGDSTLNNNIAHWIGRYAEVGFPSPFDGYLAEYNFIDGQALTPNSFGSSNGLGVWQPIRYGGSYGTNGFYLPFTNTTSTTTLGFDFSPNGNNWTTNNISLTAGSTYDSMTDVPTLTNITTANYCVLNPLDKGTNMTVLSANLQTTSSAAAWTTAVATIGITSGKWYWEYAPTSGSDIVCGIVTSQATRNNHVGSDSYGWAYYSGGDKVANNSFTAYGASYTSSDTIGVAFDADNGTLTFYKNNTSQGTAFTGLTGSTYFPANSHYQGATWINFGQRPFTYTPPTGFVRLNTFNLPTPTIGATASTTANKYFNAVTYTGAGAGTVITTGFYPDFAWMKNRTAAFSNFVQDSVRGGGVYLLTDATFADDTVSPSSTFSSTGITINGLSSYASNSSYNYVLWAWKANAGTNVSNTAGSITSTVSANTTAGFSIVTWTGSGSNSDQTIGTGLSTALDFIIAKPRDSGGGTDQWLVYTSAITLNQNQCLLLNSSNATTTTANSGTPSRAATAGQLKLWAGSTNNQNLNASGLKYVAYCFAQIAGYSAFGSYTGNGSSDGVFVYLGFRARFIMIKSTSTGGWVMLDTARDTYNDVDNYLYAQSSAAEAGSSNVLDINANGFKIRNSWTDINGSGTTYVYMAFAESPFRYANAR